MRAQYDSKAFRDVLTKRFSSEDFRVFCYDHFRDVYEKFGDNMTKQQLIQLLIEHCERTDRMGELLSILSSGYGVSFHTHTYTLPKNQNQHKEGYFTPISFGNIGLHISRDTAILLTAILFLVIAAFLAQMFGR
jgi:Effector-associated domain 7